MRRRMKKGGEERGGERGTVLAMVVVFVFSFEGGFMFFPLNLNFRLAVVAPLASFLDGGGRNGEQAARV